MLNTAGGAVRAMARFVSVAELRNFSQQLAALHKPTASDWAARFGLRGSPRATSADEEGLAVADASTGNSCVRCHGHPQREGRRVLRRPSRPLWRPDPVFQVPKTRERGHPGVVAALEAAEWSARPASGPFGVLWRAVSQGLGPVQHPRPKPGPAHRVSQSRHHCRL
jgi:hypothetical protein